MVDKHYRNFEVEHPVRYSDEYAMHMSAMTIEKLRSKSDIALELAERDMRIQSLQRQLAEAQELLSHIQKHPYGGIRVVGMSPAEWLEKRESEE